MKRLSAIFVVIIIALTATTIAMGGLFDFSKTLEGTIKDVAAGLIVVTHEDAEKNTISEQAFEINAQTKFEEVVSLNELKEGDQVKVEYKQEKEKMIATLVAKILPEQEAGTTQLNL